ncbi:MAG: FkbM family methyltransferase [Phycisphaerales bacterium]|nr:FkbM family methyltransferase [Phycisphaerales bacterium]
MDVSHTILRIANVGLLRRALHLANRVRPPRPVSVRVDGHRIYAATLDRLAALWMRKLTAAERYETRLWTELIKPGMIVADVGANLGVYTLLAAQHVGSTGRVHGFEPDQDNHDLLLKNITTNGYTNVTVHRSAVADEVGMVSLYRRLEHRGDHRIYQAEGAARPSVEVPVTTLDAVFSESQQLDVLKLDIQGAEPRALAGMTELLKGNPELNLITEFWPEGLRQSGADPYAFLAALRDHGFAIRRINDQREQLEELSDDELLALCRKIRYTNLLAARKQ